MKATTVTAIFHSMGIAHNESKHFTEAGKKSNIKKKGECLLTFAASEDDI